MQALDRKLDVALVQILPYNWSETDPLPAVPGCGLHPQTPSVPTIFFVPPPCRDHCSIKFMLTYTRTFYTRIRSFRLSCILSHKTESPVLYTQLYTTAHNQSIKSIEVALVAELLQG